MVEKDLTLLCAARKLEPEALIKIFDQYSPPLYSYVLRLGGDPLLADQIVGDVFARFLEQLFLGKGPSVNLRSYLFQSAHNLVVDEVRYTHRRVPLDVLDMLPYSTGSTTTNVQDRLFLREVWQAIQNDLTVDQRHVVILRLLEGFSLRETAHIVGKTTNHVKVIQNRAIAVLRKVLRYQLTEIGDTPAFSN